MVAPSPQDLARGRRRAPQLLALAAAAALAGGCGRSDAGPAQYAVADRDIRWRAAAPATAHQPFGLDWDGAAERAPPGSRLSPWHAPEGAPAAEHDLAGGRERLVLRGTGDVDLVGPQGVPVDPQLQQWLVLRLDAGRARSLVIEWRRHDEEFASARSTPALPLAAAAGAHTLTFALAGLRGVHEAGDAEQGVDEFRLRFSGEAGAPLEVAVERIALVSDYDAAPDGLHAGRLVRSGQVRRGVALRVPGTLETELPCAAGDRLRFALATAGLDAAASVELAERDGRLPPVRLQLAPDGRWTESRLQLPDAPPTRPLHLVLRVEAPDSRRPGVLLLGSVTRLAPAPESTPPVVLYVEDTLRADHLGAYGWPHPADPRLAAIARDGAVFERSFTTASWTRPAMSSLMTSLDPFAHGNRTPEGRVPDELETLAEALEAAGYLTASFVTNYQAGAWSGLDQGFDPHRDPTAFGTEPIESTLTSGTIREPIESFLREHADERLFVFAHSLDPHGPYRPPEDCRAALAADGAPRVAPEEVGDAARWERDTLAYDGEILNNDRALGALDDVLAELGLRERTLFVFVSDHGEAFGEHGRWGHQRSLHEEEIRVPWILRWPQRVPAGTRLSLPVSLLDVAPTVLGLCGAEAPPAWQGRNLSAALLSGQLPPDAHARPFLLDVVYADEAPRGAEELAAVLWPWKLVVAREAGDALRPVALFDLAADPRERRDLLADPAPGADVAARVEGLRAFLAERLAAGPLVSGAGSTAGALDPAVEAWMRQMGYLR